MAALGAKDAPGLVKTSGNDCPLAEKVIWPSLKTSQAQDCTSPQGRQQAAPIALGA